MATPAAQPDPPHSDQPDPADFRLPTQAGVVPVVMNLGRLAYEPALQIQLQVHEQVLDRRSPPTLILVEHDPVITVSRRPSAGQNLVAPATLLTRLGIDVQPTDRGGDITYHGPGQLVVYPIIRLADLGLNVGAYMRKLEQAVIDALATWGVQAFRDPPNTGVWTRLPNASPNQSPAKICAMGVRVKRNVAMHGLALNVTTNLSHFQTIIPCGLVGRSVTSIEQLLGHRTPTMAQVQAELVAQLQRQLTA